MGEIDMGRGLISPDLGNGEVIHIPGNPVSTETVHIPRNPVSTETVHIRGDLDDIGTITLPRVRATPRSLTFSGESSQEFSLPKGKAAL